MSAPDVREWYRIDPDEPALRQHQEAIEAFKAAHPNIVDARGIVRLTILGIDRGEPWLCIDGWLTAPDDQGPAPTDVDIPAGFV
jgi:hypothetical protein